MPYCCYCIPARSPVPLNGSHLSAWTPACPSTFPAWPATITTAYPACSPARPFPLVCPLAACLTSLPSGHSACLHSRVPAWLSATARRMGCRFACPSGHMHTPPTVPECTTPALAASRLPAYPPVCTLAKPDRMPSHVHANLHHIHFYFLAMAASTPLHWTHSGLAACPIMHACLHVWLACLVR